MITKFKMIIEKIQKEVCLGHWLQEKLKNKY